MASIRKNQNGTYTATIYLGRDNSGRQIRKYVTRAGLKETKLAAQELEQEERTRDIAAAASMKMEKYLDRWLEINGSRIAPTTYRSYKIYIDHHFKPAFGFRKVGDVKELHIKEYVGEKLKNLSPTTVRKHYFVLQAIFRDALKHRSPMADIRPPKQKDFRPDLPTAEDIKKIAEKFADIGPEWEAIILLASWCGMRRGEIFALRWDDISDEGYIKIDEAVSIGNDSYKFKARDPKSEKGKRTVATPDYLINLLYKIKEGQKVIDIKNSSLVFTVTAGQFTQRYYRLKEKGKIPAFRFHDLRHYHASYLYAHNIPDHYAAERLGHDISVLKKIYQHLGLDQKKEIDDTVKGLFDK